MSPMPHRIRTGLAVISALCSHSPHSQSVEAMISLGRTQQPLRAVIEVSDGSHLCQVCVDEYTIKTDEGQVSIAHISRG